LWDNFLLCGGPAERWREAKPLGAESSECDCGSRKNEHPKWGAIKITNSKHTQNRRGGACVCARSLKEAERERALHSMMGGGLAVRDDDGEDGVWVFQPP
jgi:hypothetical protein